MTVKREVAITAAAIAAAGILVGGVTAVSNASTAGQVAATGYSRGGDSGGDGPGRGGHEHTAVTGDELAKVTAAVKAKDSTITVETVRKDPDGSYDVMGTKDGNRVMVEVTKDLGTIEVRTGGPGGHGGHGGRGGHAHTAVTGDELAKVTAAVKAKDSTITVETVRKDPDGSYDVMGTKDGNRVMVEVTKDLGTIEVRTGGPGRHGGGRQPASTPTESATSTT
jgi:hypothetical protein